MLRDDWILTVVVGLFLVPPKLFPKSFHLEGGSSHYCAVVGSWSVSIIPDFRDLLLLNLNLGAEPSSLNLTS